MNEAWWAILPGLLAALVFHEYAHGAVASALGDPTPRQTGRLTLNPLVHIDPVGALMFWLFHFGWARPVMVNPAYFARPRRDMMLVAAAGPAANFALALLLLVGGRLGGIDQGTPLGSVMAWAVLYNVWLGVFNLLPVPPLDGSKVLLGLVPGRAAWMEQWQQYGWIILVVLVATGWVGRLLDPAMDAVLGLLSAIARALEAAAGVGIS